MHQDSTIQLLSGQIGFNTLLDKLSILVDNDELVVPKEYKEIQPAYYYTKAAQTPGGTRNKKYPKMVKGNKEISQPETLKLGAKKAVRVKPKSKPQEKASAKKPPVQQRSTRKK